MKQDTRRLILLLRTGWERLWWQMKKGLGNSCFGCSGVVWFHSSHVRLWEAVQLCSQRKPQGAQSVPNRCGNNNWGIEAAFVDKWKVETAGQIKMGKNVMVQLLSAHTFSSPQLILYFLQLPQLSFHCLSSALSPNKPCFSFFFFLTSYSASSVLNPSQETFFPPAFQPSSFVSLSHISILISCTLFLLTFHQGCGETLKTVTKILVKIWKAGDKKQILFLPVSFFSLDTASVWYQEMEIQFLALGFLLNITLQSADLCFFPYTPHSQKTTQKYHQSSQILCKHHRPIPKEGGFQYIITQLQTAVRRLYNSDETTSF